MAPVIVSVTRVDINAQIALVRSQLEKLSTFAKETFNRSFPEIVDVLARDNENHSLSAHLNTLENLLVLRDSVLGDLHREAADVAERLQRLTVQVDSFAMPAIKQSLAKSK